MSSITNKTERLLDRLYNLRGEESVVIKTIENKIDEISSLIEETANEKDRDESYKNETTEKLENFLTQVDVFTERFGSFDNDTFAELRAIGINLEIENILNTINEKAPEYSNSLIEETKNAQESIDTKNNRIGVLTSEKNNRQDELAEAKRAREELNFLLEQSLSTRPEDGDKENLTRKYINSILAPLGAFAEEEIYELSKLIQYPEDGLYEFDSTYEERLASGKVKLFDEPATEEVVEEPTVEEEPVEIEQTVTEEPVMEYTEEKEEYEEPVTETEYTYEEPKEEVAPIEVEETYNMVNEEEVTLSSDQTAEEAAYDNYEEDNAPTTVINLSELSNAVENDKEVVPEETSDTTSDIKDYLVELGMDLVKFNRNNVSVDNVYELLANTDKELIKGNYEVLRSINADEAVYNYKDGYMYLTDKDLNSKLTLLRSKGISEKKITEMVLKEMAA